MHGMCERKPVSDMNRQRRNQRKEKELQQPNTESVKGSGVAVIIFALSQRIRAACVECLIDKEKKNNILENPQRMLVR